ncbi:MAG: esterase-like activity of phytase family protein [Coleofasciculaceae cyanobacterium SM2_3_26]|nr:esterase-like activity of phytase family protein [Coleofasciculaceae cyanobacterium SM2_3_26]
MVLFHDVSQVFFRNEGDRPLLAKIRNLVCFLLGCLLFLSCGGGEPTQATPQVEPSIPEQFSDFEILHQVTFPTGYSFEDTEFGGLSGITYDAQRDVYYAISDDRSIKAPARFYTIHIDTNAGTVEPIATTFLKNETGENFPPLSLDPEAIALIGRDRLLIASEGDRERQIEPLIAEFSLRW